MFKFLGGVLLISVVPTSASGLTDTDRLLCGLAVLTAVVLMGCGLDELFFKKDR